VKTCVCILSSCFVRPELRVRRLAVIQQEISRNRFAEGPSVGE